MAIYFYLSCIWFRIETHDFGKDITNRLVVAQTKQLQRQQQQQNILTGMIWTRIYANHATILHECSSMYLTEFAGHGNKHDTRSYWDEIKTIGPLNWIEIIYIVGVEGYVFIKKNIEIYGLDLSLWYHYFFVL